MSGLRGKIDAIKKAIKQLEPMKPAYLYFQFEDGTTDKTPWEDLPPEEQAKYDLPICMTFIDGRKVNAQYDG